MYAPINGLDSDSVAEYGSTNQGGKMTNLRMFKAKSEQDVARKQ